MEKKRPTEDSVEIRILLKSLRKIGGSTWAHIGKLSYIPYAGNADYRVIMVDFSDGEVRGYSMRDYADQDMDRLVGKKYFRVEDVDKL